jgi:hypothetical protein
MEQHYAGMKAILCLPLFLASCAWADEAADRAAIARVIASLNEQPWPAAQVTESAAASSELAHVWKLRPLLIGTPGAPTVTVSHEPWGEATIDFPSLEGRLPRIVGGAVRFVTPDVALADGAWAFPDGITTPQPLLFVMKKVGDDWKLASVRLLAPNKVPM